MPCIFNLLQFSRNIVVWSKYLSNLYYSNRVGAWTECGSGKKDDPPGLSSRLCHWSAGSYSARFSVVLSILEVLLAFRMLGHLEILLLRVWWVQKRWAPSALAEVHECQGMLQHVYPNNYGKNLWDARYRSHLLWCSWRRPFPSPAQGGYNPALSSLAFYTPLDRLSSLYKERTFPIFLIW